MGKALKFMFKYLFLLLLGGNLYYYIEVLYRGYSHWSMFILGAICFLFCSVQNQCKAWEAPLWKQIFRCVIFVLVGEFITGCMVNLWQGWQVWDYSQVPLNLMGQICLPYAFLFSGVCLAAIVLDDYIRYFCFGEKKPSYYWLDSLKPTENEVQALKKAKV